MPLSENAIESIARDYTNAWNSGEAAAVASFYAETGEIVINSGSPWVGRDGIAQMASGFFADVPDLLLTCDKLRIAGAHVAYLWTFTGTHSGTNRPLRIEGWEEWDLDETGKVASSREWYDASGYARQVEGR